MYIYIYVYIYICIAWLSKHTKYQDLQFIFTSHSAGQKAVFLRPKLATTEAPGEPAENIDLV